MVLEHHVPVSRLTHSYFRRWWFWKGISHARLHRILIKQSWDWIFDRLRRVCGVPGYILRSMACDAVAAIAALVRGRWRAAVGREMMVWYAVGYACEQLQHRETGYRTS